VNTSSNTNVFCLDHANVCEALSFYAGNEPIQQVCRWPRYVDIRDKTQRDECAIQFSEKYFIRQA
jgi:hypothetical protein